MSGAHDFQAEPFDPTLPGTPEHRWERLLNLVPDWSAAPGSLLVVSPHPDDEVLATGGLMRLHAAAGLAVTVLSVTDGAAAYPDWVGLDLVRRRELADALHVLGGGAIELIHLGLPDGRVGAFRRRLHDALGGLVTDRPTIVAPYELDGHPDHDATGATCAEFARLHRLTLIRYPVWTWHHAAPESFTPTVWGRVRLDPGTQHAKFRAIECFASQLRPPGRQPIVPPHVLGYFKRGYEAFLL
jgi:LmbE family N-acetylglucosaminyl deacetylase